MSGGVAHDLTLADVESGQWVRAVSRHTSGAEQTLYGPVTGVSRGTLLEASWSVVCGTTRCDWTLVSCERVDPPPPPRPDVPTGRNAIVRLAGGIRAWRADGSALPWVTAAGGWLREDKVAALITDVIWPGEQP